MALKATGAIVILDTLGNVLGLTDIKLAAWIFQDVHPEHKAAFESKRQRPLLSAAFWSKRFGSAGKTRTYNPPVNSRMLCH
jgi:hypothetical protein